MKFLIYGHNGWIGEQVVSLISKHYVVILGTSKLEDDKGVELEILKQCPDRVLSLAGRFTESGEHFSLDDLDRVEKVHDSMRDNLYGPLALALICTRLNIHLTYLGTGSIFNSKDGGLDDIYGENDIPNVFESSYLMVRGFTDQLMHQFESSVLNIRIQMPISADHDPINLITKLTQQRRASSTPNSITILPDMLPIMVDMAKRKVTGTINLANPGVITDHEILNLYKSIVDPSFTWEDCVSNTKEQHKSHQDILKVSRNDSSNVMNTSKLEQMYPHIPPVKESLAVVLQKIQGSRHPYQPKSVLVTGACGFIGSNTLTYLISRYPDIEFVNLDKMDYCSSTKSVRVKDGAKYTLYKGNINDTGLTQSIFKKHGIDTIIHFAAQTHVDNSFGNSVHFTEDNVLGTHNLLESVRAFGKIRRFIHISTDEVYGEVSDSHLGCDEENSLLNPTNPYAATKVSAEFIVRSYNHSFKLPTIISRGNNVYGPYQYPEKLIPRFILQLLNNQKCTIHGEGASKRNFIHVDDTARAVESILLHGRINEIYNIGTKNEYSVKEIAHKLISLMKPNEPIEDWITYVPDRAFNDRRYFVKAQKLQKLGWIEQVNFEQGLLNTIEWYRNNQDFFTIPPS